MANRNVCSLFIHLSHILHPNCKDYTPQFKGEIICCWLQYSWRIKMPVKHFRQSHAV